MKTRFFKIAGIAAITLFGLVSCQDFLEEKQNFDNLSPELYNHWDGVLARLSDAYTWVLPDAQDIDMAYIWRNPSNGSNKDMAGKSTEEYAGFSGAYLDPQTIFAPDQTAPDYFEGTNKGHIQQNVWGHIRNVNDIIEGVKGSTGITQEQKNMALGQLYVLRAWRYFMLWKWYGGVPIIKVNQPIVPGTEVPRSTSKAVFEFILNDLNTAADLLEEATGNGQWINGDNYGRVTTGTALGLKSRLLAWWCSPLFNRTQDAARYEAAYREIQGDLDRIHAAKYGFNHNNADEWADMFNDFGTLGGNSEAVFFRRHNSYDKNQTPDHLSNNLWENAIRPSNTAGGGGLNPSVMIINLFPMADGKLPAGQGSSLLPHSTDEYHAEYPFLNRDPRFYRTFAFPGMKWGFHGTVMSNESKFPFNGPDYELWNYVWYNEPKADYRAASGRYGADALGSPCGVYVTKRSAATALKGAYEYTDYGSVGVQSKGFERSYASNLELRYAEVLLNMAEIACGAGHTDEAYQYLRDIRLHVGYTGDCGIVASGDPATCFAAILYERQIELAFEGKRFDDMRRWLLFDGGVNMMNVAGAPETWQVKGWGGNTCAYLGVEPLNGHRRENIEYRVSIKDGVGGQTWVKWNDMPDPIAETVLEDGTVKLPETAPEDATKDSYKWEAFRNWRSTFAVDLSDKENLQANLQNLVDNFYKPYLTYQEKRGDGTDGNANELNPEFRPHCYFAGFSTGVQSNNPTLPNNIGWGNGTFDPLAE